VCDHDDVVVIQPAQRAVRACGELHC
jgi:hypothetical protein